MTKFSHGLIIGKFYPPHEGHHFLIETALSECEHVTVLVLANDSETMSMSQRELLLEACHPDTNLDVQSIRCNLPVDYESREADKAHAKLIYDWLSAPALNSWSLPNVLYSSEPYGERIAADLTDLYPLGRIDHRMVDLQRVARPISATAIRKNPAAHWDALRGPVRAALTKRIVICGAESTGTTTLAKALAERYQTVWVPEYGRTFSEAVGNSHRWTSDDFMHIVDEQNRMEEDLARYAGPVMFCDTDGMATAMFHELYMKGPAPAKLWGVVRNWSSSKSLYLITDHVGVKFEDDGYRLFQHQRQWATRWFERYLPITVLAPYELITGTHTQRMERATQLVDACMTWEFGPAGDEL